MTVKTWMPIYIADYLTDTRHLSTLEHGAYLLLIFSYWRDGPLPNDDDHLAALAGLNKKDWVAKIGPKIRKFFSLENNELRHKRIDAERVRAQQLSDKRKAVGRSGGLQKASNSLAKATVLLKQNPTPSPSPLQSSIPPTPLPAAEVDEDTLDKISDDLMFIGGKDPTKNAPDRNNLFLREWCNAGADGRLIRKLAAAAMEKRGGDPLDRPLSYFRKVLEPEIKAICKSREAAAKVVSIATDPRFDHEAYAEAMRIWNLDTAQKAFKPIPRIENFPKATAL